MDEIFSNKDKYVLFGFFGAIFFIIVCAALLIIWYQKKDNTYATIGELKTLKAEDIDSIVIKKYENAFKVYKNSLVVDNIIIDNTEKINNIWKTVSLNNIYSPGHPVAKWLCYLEIHRKNGDKCTLVIKRLTPWNKFDERGTLIEIWTHIDAGNILGEFRSDALGAFLEEIAKEKGLYNSKGISNKW